MIRKQWQKVREIFSSTKRRANDHKIAFVDDQSIVDESLQKQISHKDENNVKTLQQDIILPAHNSTEVNLPEFLMSLDIDSYKLIKKNWEWGNGRCVCCPRRGVAQESSN